MKQCGRYGGSQNRTNLSCESRLVLEFEVGDLCPSFNYENQSLRLYLTSSKNGVITTKKKTVSQPLLGALSAGVLVVHPGAWWGMDKSLGYTEDRLDWGLSRVGPQPPALRLGHSAGQARTWSESRQGAILVQPGQGGLAEALQACCRHHPVEGLKQGPDENAELEPGQGADLASGWYPHPLHMEP